MLLILSNLVTKGPRDFDHKTGSALYVLSLYCFAHTVPAKSSKDYNQRNCLRDSLSDWLLMFKKSATFLPFKGTRA